MRAESHACSTRTVSMHRMALTIVCNGVPDAISDATRNRTWQQRARHPNAHVLLDLAHVVSSAGRAMLDAEITRPLTGYRRGPPRPA